MQNKKFATRAIHAGQEADPSTGATIAPIYATSTFTQGTPGEHKGYEYSRTGNPTRSALEECLASLEGARYGLAFSSRFSSYRCSGKPAGTRRKPGFLL